MTALPPPTYYFDGITFNSAFYPSTSTVTSSSGNGITEAQANLLYLRKTTTDTATSLETFSAGIATSSIDTASSGGTLSIGGNNATGGLNLGKLNYTTTVKGDLSIDGTTTSIKLPENGSIDLKTAGTYLNIGNNNASNVNIGRALSRINLKGGTYTDLLDSIGNTLNIGSGNASTAINIGNGFASTTITNLRSASLDTPAGTTVLAIGNTNATTGINLGSALIPTAVQGALTASGNIVMNGTASTNYIQFPDGTKQYTAGGGGGGTYVNYPTPQGSLTALAVSGTLTTSTIDTPVSGTLAIGGTNATASQSYAGALTTGALNIGANCTGAITIGSSSNTVPASINGVQIGGTNNSIQGGSTSSAFQIDHNDLTGDISLGDSQTTGIINIGTAAGRINTGGATKGAINIGTGAGANAFGINIGGSGTTTTINGTLSIPGTFSPASVSSPQMVTSSIDTISSAYILEIGKTNASSGQNYAQALTTNNLTIAAAQTTGAINIGCGSGRINTTGGLGAINIGTGAGANAFGINIGGSGTTTTIGGTLAVSGAYSPASLTTSGLITANGGLTMGGSNNITLGNGSVKPSSTQLGFVGYSANGTAGYVTTGMRTSALGATPYMYGVAQLSPGTYMFSTYFSPGSTFTYARVLYTCGAATCTDPSATGIGGTTQAAFSPTLVFPSNGGNGIITLMSGGPASGEWTSFGMGIITSANPYIGIAIGIAGTGSYISGTYSFQYLRIA